MRLAILLIASALSCHAQAVVSLGQFFSSAANCSGSTTTNCNSPTLTALTAGQTVAFALSTQSASAPTSVADAQGDVIVPATACNSNNGGAAHVYCYYILSAVGGTTSITASVATGTGRQFWGVTFSTTGSGFLFDAAGSLNTGTSCTSCTGVALALSRTTDVIVQFSDCGDSGTACTISSPYVAPLDASPAVSRAISYAIYSSGAAPTWTVGSVTSNWYTGAIALSSVTASMPVIYEDEQ